MDTVVRLSFSYCDIQLSNWRIDAGGLTLINNVQSHMERCADMAVSFHWSKPCSFDLFLWLLSETGFRITHINDECKRYGQPSVFLAGSAHATESAPVVLRVHLYEKRND